jgi:hypothetical protein
MNLLYAILLGIVIYFFFLKKKETFETNQIVGIKTADGMFASICADKHLCLVSDDSQAKQFSVMKFADDLIALENQGYYITSCFGENCTDMIKVDSFNPYAPNAKLKLIKDGDTHSIQLFDGHYLGKDAQNHFVREKNVENAVKLIL